MGHLHCKDNGFLSCPDLKPSCDKEVFHVVTWLQGQTSGIPHVPPTSEKPSQPKDPARSMSPGTFKSFALDAVFGFHFPFEKLQGHFTKLGNRIQIRSQFAFFTVNRHVLKLLSRMQSIIPYQILPCLKSMAITFNFVRVCVLWSCINS